MALSNVGDTPTGRLRLSCENNYAVSLSLFPSVSLSLSLSF